MIAEAIFNAKIRYGIALYLNPVFDKEDLKRKYLSRNTSVLQVLQNTMLRMIYGYRMEDMVNMENLRKEIGMSS